jgi:hypothetical protein
MTHNRTRAPGVAPTASCGGCVWPAGIAAEVRVDRRLQNSRVVTRQEDERLTLGLFRREEVDTDATSADSRPDRGRRFCSWGRTAAMLGLVLRRRL